LFAQPQEASQEGFSIAETVSNIPSSAVQFGEDIIEPILSPVETAKSLQSLGQGLVEKALPSEIHGFDFGQTQNEEVVDAVGTFINERYGSTDAFKNTIQTDPVGALADIAGLLTGGSTLLPKAGKVGSLAKAVEGVGKALDPLNLSTSAVKSLAKSGKVIPESLPVSLLETALKFRPSIKPAQRASMTKTALKQGIIPTVGGLRTITDKLDSLDTSLNKIIDGATNRGVQIPKSMVFAELGKLRKDLGGVKIDAGADLRIIDKVAKDFNQNLIRLKKKNLTPRELQDLKQDTYKRINFDKAQGDAGFAKNEARKAIARQAKKGVESIDPSVGPINREMGELLELNSELERIVGRLDNRNLISLDTAAKIGGGGAAGGPLGTAAGTASAALGAPRVKARTAILMENLRKNAETIDVINNTRDPVLARALATQAGRLNQTLNAQLDEEGEL